mmetsp:Transcript_352/g.911  ORF Transcript_352/g.911 Transcript_352/m.911 type:complete len:232 (-) Transcript_352:86-781(-)
MHSSPTSSAARGWLMMLAKRSSQAGIACCSSCRERASESLASPSSDMSLMHLNTTVHVRDRTILGYTSARMKTLKSSGKRFVMMCGTWLSVISSEMRTRHRIAPCTRCGAPACSIWRMWGMSSGHRSGKSSLATDATAMLAAVRSFECSSVSAFRSCPRMRPLCSSVTSGSWNPCFDLAQCTSMNCLHSTAASCRIWGSTCCDMRSSSRARPKPWWALSCDSWTSEACRVV